MRKIQFILGILAAASSSATLAYDGTIDFSGQVVAQTCSVEADSTHLVVILPTVSTASLTSPGDVAGLTPFAIVLEGCSTDVTGVGTKVYAFFEPNADTDNETHNLNIKSNSNSAKNVQIQLMNADGTSPIYLGTQGNQGQTPVVIDKDTMQLWYNAQYYATGQATAGNVSATVNYTIAYQ
ncbi:type 1 fimbrial protein [Escherichia coli]|nr:fimbrial protein [Escherichia coli]EIQ9741253.1 type 1 fimbrial protein [Escherichia coli]MBS9582055.1 type 1 fimbrial protein [Escherichia coli]MVW51391.1 fimbrial protein [Escherichia coli]MXF33952.1 type 1 fimbrial protein [Escherichia coli]GDQ13611.1 F17-like fimbrial subunit [Escherichia coli]